MLIDGHLFRQISRTYPKPRRVPPISDRPSIIDRIHRECGHYGVQRTLGLVSKSYFWPGMTVDVRKHVAKCSECQVEKATFKCRTELMPLPIATLFERISVDLVGPLTRSRRGNEYIAVAIDAFSKYIIASALPNRLSSTVAEFMFSKVICRISCPVICRTDHGSEFQLDFQELLKKYGIIHQMSSPHHPSANGQVERANKTIIDSIRRNMSTELNTWDDHLDRVVYGYNITKQSSTNFSPHFLLYNQDPRLGDPLDADALLAETTTAKLMQDTVQARTDQRHDVTKDAVRNMVVSQNEQRLSYEKRRPMDPPLYETDTYVLIKKHTKSKKLAHAVEGPYMLRAYNSDHTTVLVEDASGKRWTEHASFITPYTHGDPVPMQEMTQGEDAEPTRRPKRAGAGQRKSSQ